MIAMPRRGEFRVSVSKDYLVFASAHFITFAGHRCEGLHGHNYRARVTIEGALDEYYRLAGWDATTGNPTAATLARLGLAWAG